MDIYLILSLLTLPLAVWRLSNMFADTDQEGLFGSLDKIRSILRVKMDQWSTPYGESGSIAAGILCPACSSLWFGILFAIMLFCSTKLTFFFTLPLALSALVMFMEGKREQDA